ncbi:Uncharacterised protein [Mycobacteroides abscessus subsp. abscessus]|nr:Uncharacterised protein [Mycobacteroides abscessus subsp. abscessus]
MAGQACIGAISATSPDSGQLWLLPVYGAVCRSYSERCAYRKWVVKHYGLAMYYESRSHRRRIDGYFVRSDTRNSLARNGTY